MESIKTIYIILVLIRMQYVKTISIIMVVRWKWWGVNGTDNTGNSNGAYKSGSGWGETTMVTTTMVVAETTSGVGGGDIHHGGVKQNTRI